MHTRHLSICFFLLSASMIAFQVSLTRYLSIVQWYHFAYMVIAVAMLGFGASGTFISIFRDRLLKKDHSKQFRLIGVLVIIAGLSMPLSIFLAETELFKFDSYEIFVSGSEWLRLLVNYLFFFTPFLFTATALGLGFYRYPDIIGKLYFANLTGSGLGAVLSLLLLAYVDIFYIFYITGLMALISGIWLLASTRLRGVYKQILLAAGIMLFLFLVRLPGSTASSPYKDLSKTLALPEAERVYTTNSIHGLIEVVRSPVLRYSSGVSMVFRDTIPRVEVVFNNGNWYGAIPLEAGKATRALRATTRYIPFTLCQPDSILILHAGAGERIIMANTLKAADITATEVLQPVTNRIQGSPELRADRTLPVHARSFLQYSSTHYDLISFPICGTPGGGSGLNAIQENYLYTREAFTNAAERLNNGGILEVSGYLDYPCRVPLKLLATFAEGISGSIPPGEPISRYLAAVRSWNTVTYFFKKGGFNNLEFTQIREACDSLNFDPLILPGITSEERTWYNEPEDESLFEGTDAILNNRYDDFSAQYSFQIDPATDDKPYFGQFLKLSWLGSLISTFGLQNTSFIELGYLLLLLTIIQLILLAFLLVMVPLLLVRSIKKVPIWVTVYFSGIGIGYMFTELVLIQRFTLFLDDPVLAVSAVIGSLLVFSGIGSYISGVNRVSRFRQLFFLAILIFILLTYSLVLPGVFEAMTQLGTVLKYTVSALIAGIPGVIMGLMFPLGVKELERESTGYIPWAWAVNNYFSVIAASLAVLIAINSGISVVFYSAALAYALPGLVLAWKIRKK